ncbi:MAG: diguanylate cyclase [Acidaminobacteraceae bacterium]
MKAKRIIGKMLLQADKRELSGKLEHVSEGLFDSNTAIQIIDSIPNPVYYKDADKEFKLWNKAFLRYMELPSNYKVRGNIFDIVDYEYAKIHDEVDNQVLKNKCGYEYESKIKTSKGRYRDVLINKMPMFDDAGDVIGISATMTDLSSRIESEEMLQKLVKMKDAMLEVNQEAIRHVDLKTLMKSIIEKVVDVMGDDFIGSVMKVHGDKLKFFTSYGYERFEREEYYYKIEDSFLYLSGSKVNPIIIDDTDGLINVAKFPVDKEGNECRLRSMITTPIIIGGELKYTINVDSMELNSFNEMDLELMTFVKAQVEVAIENKTLYDEIVNLSRFDKLTNIFNRRYFEEHFENILIKSKRYNESFAMVIFDLNGLKATNDKYGHLAGDNVIKEFANVISSAIRESDIFARFGGDEFIGIFFESDIAKLKVKFENIISNNLIKTTFDKNTIDIGFSYGISKYPEDGLTYNELFNKADDLMYAYKTATNAKKLDDK